MKAKDITKFKMKGFSKALRLLTLDNEKEYRCKMNSSTDTIHDCSNYTRILRWSHRTTSKLINYLIYYDLAQTTTEKDIDFFMHHLLAIYFQSYEQFYAIHETPPHFMNGYLYFIDNCLNSYKKINRKGHFLERNISFEDMFFFFDYFLGTPDELLEKEYRLSAEQKEKISQLYHHPTAMAKDLFFELSKIFFKKS